MWFQQHQPTTPDVSDRDAVQYGLRFEGSPTWSDIQTHCFERNAGRDRLLGIAYQDDAVFLYASWDEFIARFNVNLLGLQYFPRDPRLTISWRANGVIQRKSSHLVSLFLIIRGMGFTWTPKDARRVVIVQSVPLVFHQPEGDLALFCAMHRME